MSCHPPEQQSQSRYRKNWDPTEEYKNVAVAEQYDEVRFTSLAGRIFNYLDKRAIRRAFAGIGPDARIVDIPCGTGRLSEVLLEAGHQVQGVDISPAMAEVARRKLARFGDRFSVRIDDARSLRDDGRAFDAALCARVLMHFRLDEQIGFLKGVARVTKGPIVFTHSLDTRYQRFRRMVKRILRHQNPVSFPVTEAQLRELMQQAGLVEIRRFRPLPLLTEAIIVIAERN